MQRLELTLPKPAENVALDEALLEWAEERDPDWECLRIWESTRPMVVLGRSSRALEEIDNGICRERGIDVIRRSSGGAAIVAGPGCLMYAVVLSYKLRPQLRDIRLAHREVLGRLVPTLQSCMAGTERVLQAGTSDLALASSSSSHELRKFSGNSLRARRTHFLYHGTLLYDFDLRLIETCLKTPPRQPEYRDGRAHSSFVSNLTLTRSEVVNAVHRAWPTDGELPGWPMEKFNQLMADRFDQLAWNFER